MKFKQIARFYHIIKTLLTYGVDEVLPYNRYTRPFRCWRNTLFWLRNQHKDKAFGLRLRLALQELGPVWIKLGQMLSTRRDLFPPEIADELALLQDQVDPFDGQLAREQIEQALGGPLETWFTDFNETALASASIAQVHTVRFKDSELEVVFKVLRPDIQHAIEADLSLMYQLATWLPRLSSEGHRLRAVEVVREYEKTLRDELDLRREMANAIQLRANFENSPMLYIPQMYTEFCHRNVIVMERIYGIPVSNIAELEANGTDMKLLAERGVQVFFTQVFRDSFFHADMHPGNIFVSREHPHDPQYIGIDCGIIGRLGEHDKRYLAESFVAFFNRDYRRVAEMHVRSGWTPADTDIDAFEQAFREVCEPIFAKPLSEISFGQVLLNLFNVAREFNMEVQPQLVLLQKTLLYIEGLGRQLYPQLDLWQTAKPFLQNWLDEQVGVKSVVKKLQQKLPHLREQFVELPETLFNALAQQEYIQQELVKINKNLQKQVHEHKKYRVLGLGCVIFLGTLWQYTALPVGLSSVLLVLSVIIWTIGFILR
ncbi:ubiquinone biosynthesis regulatory protein kinase UbiB [Conservatibacter flavescens]|uniref:Probable protein kinase UbiB n=1 Tax=Conservatibacter flavescens TaxID=28161 RepID=A0A2M8S1T5_9PAST|nr:ubiquinone biosynthesis regulatory protein kinase UbiB [Conservatibacter flavescens]PJG85121.1 ubiquinone biosynthesis regulatory protein kinase UbiB [Conservatibacter flavescens]